MLHRSVTVVYRADVIVTFAIMMGIDLISVQNYLPTFEVLNLLTLLIQPDELHILKVT